MENIGKQKVIIETVTSEVSFLRLSPSKKYIIENKINWSIHPVKTRHKLVLMRSDIGISKGRYSVVIPGSRNQIVLMVLVCFCVTSEISKKGYINCVLFIKGKTFIIITCPSRGILPAMACTLFTKQSFTSTLSINICFY